MLPKELLIQTCIARTAALDEGSPFKNFGAWVVLEIEDERFSSLARLVEDCGARLLHLCVCSDEWPRLVLLKVDTFDVSPLVQRLERHRYTVHYPATEPTADDDTLRRRAAELLHYLEL